jgi:hypothetical protein
MSEHVKVVIFALNDGFLRPIFRELKSRNTIIHSIIGYDGSPRAVASTMDALQWADYAFFDFLHDPLTLASQLKNIKCRITARLHGLEVYDPQLKEINWSRVNLIASQPQMLRWQRRKNYGEIPDAASESIINLGVNVEPTKTRKEVFGHNIAITAYTMLPRKRIYTTVESFFDLLSQTKQAQQNYPWQLHIRSEANRNGWRGEEATEYHQYIDELAWFEARRLSLDTSAITYYSHMSEVDWQKFLAGTDVIISNSMQEGYHKSVLEAMSFGAIPFVHRWLGADQIYPKECLFLTQRELVDKMMAWAALSPKEKKVISLQVQNIARDFHDEKKLAKEAVDVVLGVKEQ